MLNASSFLKKSSSDSQLILGLVGAVGTELNKVMEIINRRLDKFRYSHNMINISGDIIPQIVNLSGFEMDTEYKRIDKMMDAGNRARQMSGDNSVLALGAAAKISSEREETVKPKARQAYIIKSLKHPEEVERLREIYPEGFYLIGVHSEEQKRRDYLTKDIGMSAQEADLLIERDEDEHLPYGQQTTDVFHLSDFFIRLDGNEDGLKRSLWRILDILFGHPYRTPTFNEYAMFMAFTSSLRSADLSRQVGAVIAKNCEILATGANDCPKYGGGLYWPDNDTFDDDDRGRDYMRGADSNKIEQKRIIDGVINDEKIKETGIDSSILYSALIGSKIPVKYWNGKRKPVN